MRRREFLALGGRDVLAACGLGALAASGLGALAACAPRTNRTGIAVAGDERWAPYERALVIDGLGSPIQFNIPQEGLPLRPAVHEAVRASGITALNLTVNVQASATTTAYDATKERIAGWRLEIDAQPDVFLLVQHAADIERARAEQKLGIILGFQDGTPIEHDLRTLAEFHAAGVRIIQLTYNVKNALGCGSLVSDDTGVTPLGREAIAAMAASGIVLDLSHCSARTTREGITAATGPVAITHSGCTAVYAHPRNKDDVTLRMLAERGGVFGVYAMPFLNASGAPVTTDVIAHLEHALNVCGEDHSGIGSDQGIVPLDVSGDFPQRFAQVSAQRAAAGIAAPREDTVPYVPELNSPRRMERIAYRLHQRKHPDRVIEKVLGTNWLRLLRNI